MSKRISNDRRHDKARNGRIRYGWKTIRQMQSYEKLEKALKAENLEDALRDKYITAKNAIKAVLPKKMLRRHQGR